MTPIALLRFMSQLSRKYFGSKWADGHEYFLWREIHDRSLPRTGSPLLEPYERDHLERLSDHLDGWWVLTDENRYQFYDMTEWTRLYYEEFGDDIHE